MVVSHAPSQAGVGQLAEVLQAAQPGELDGVLDVLGRQPVLAGEPPEQRLVLVNQVAPGRSIPLPDPADKLGRIAGPRERTGCR